MRKKKSSVITLNTETPQLKIFDMTLKNVEELINAFLTIYSAAELIFISDRNVVYRYVATCNWSKHGQK